MHLSLSFHTVVVFLRDFHKVTVQLLSSVQVEYLREELGQAKAKLAESEFFREKALLELR